MRLEMGIKELQEDSGKWIRLKLIQLSLMPFFLNSKIIQKIKVKEILNN